MKNKFESNKINLMNNNIPSIVPYSDVWRELSECNPYYYLIDREVIHDTPSTQEKINQSNSEKKETNVKA